jgi:capsular polysaccharide biosynthesis protein
MERAMPQALPSHEAEPSPPGLFETTPRRPTVGDAMRRYWPVIVLVVLAFALLGAYVGHERKPVYTASSSLSVGLLDLTTQSVPGFAVGGEVVAGGFSRAVQTDAIVVPVARKLQIPPNEVRARISSTPVPDSPIFSVSATGTSSAQAVQLANAVSAAMVTYGRARSNSSAAFARLLAQYRAAVRQRDKARNRVSTIRARLSGSSTTGTQTTAASSSGNGTLGQAKADLQAQQLRVDSLADAYRTRASAPGATAAIQPLVNAQGASSDRGSRMQLYGALGALAGLCVGVALAVLITGGRDRRLRRKLS